MANDLNTRVITGKVRLSFVHLVEPSSMNGSEPKYSVSVIVPKSDKNTLAKLKEVIANAMINGKDKFGNTPEKRLKMPLRDGDEERPDDPAYEGCYFFNASNKRKPGLVDRNLNEILNADEIYSGIYAKVCVNFFPFNSQGNKGVGCSIDAVQKIADGEVLGGGRVDAKSVFSVEEDDDEDFLD